MAQIDMKADAPVGAIVAFFGNDPTVLADYGWLVCDGASLPRSDWPDLFAAIQTAFGSTGDEEFSLPDLRGVFMRSPDLGAGRDPNAADRTGSGPNGTGNDGDAIGSLQTCATAQPVKGTFFIKDNLNFGGYKTHGGCSDSDRIKYKDDDTAISVTGGDAESRPINIAAHYVIKAKANSAVDPAIGEIPLGCSLALPYDPDKRDDNPVDDFWRYCNGQTFIGAQGSTFYPLFEAIGQANGGEEEEENKPLRFAIPDLTSVFVRGVAGDRQEASLYDPDRDERETPRPDLSIPGNGGNAVGSYENWATAMPNNPLTAKLKNYPFSKTDGYQAGAASASAYKTDTKNFDVESGDEETRPLSMAVGWYIRFLKSGRSDEPGAYLPLGSIVATGSAVEVSQWQPCNGQELLISEYSDLFKIIGTTFGDDGETTFNLPDLRGRFLRGVERGGAGQRNRGEAPTSEGEYQDAATAQPHNAFQYPVKGYPTSKNNIINYGTGTKLLKIDGSKTLETSGGDDETRPININVQHLIKVLP
ncbi:phage tail protein [Microbulbifer sp. 2201CG32-9]|uniref:phage tail protein n=1 Tax=Microbulbifer sp. 2201CG32-9 TaxID=3232309 RepID=UPI00345B6B42